jgi:hypothetical protein
VKLGLESLRRALGYAGIAALVVTSLSTILLAIALLMKAREPRPVVLVPGLDAPRVVHPGQVPDALARDFAIDFATHFENFSPATVEAASRFLKGRVAPTMFQQFSAVLEKRARLVHETGMVSQFLIPDPAKALVTREEGTLAVAFPALKRVYVGDKLSQEGKLAYRVLLSTQEPTRDNPTGIYVLGQSAKAERAKEGEADGRAR